MPMVITSQETVKRTDAFLVSPYDVEMKENLRGRLFQPTKEQVVLLAESILKNGQIQPVSCRKLPDNRLQLVSGFTRCAAIRLIRTGFTDTEGNTQKDENFLIRVTVTPSMNEAEALIQNIVENLDRTERSLMDDAHNARRMVQNYGYNVADVAKVFHVSPSAINMRLKLLGLSKEDQYKVHTKELSLQAALHLVDVPEENRAETVEAVKQKNGGKVTAAALQAHLREEALKGKNKPVEIPAGTDEHKEEEGSSEENAASSENVLPQTQLPLAENHILNDDNREMKAQTPAVPAEASSLKKRPLTVKEIREFFELLGAQNNTAAACFGQMMVNFVNGVETAENVAESILDLCRTQD